MMAVHDQHLFPARTWASLVSEMATSVLPCWVKRTSPSLNLSIVIITKSANGFGYSCHTSTSPVSDSDWMGTSLDGLLSGLWLSCRFGGEGAATFLDSEEWERVGKHEHRKSLFIGDVFFGVVFPDATKRFNVKTVAKTGGKKIWIPNPLDRALRFPYKEGSSIPHYWHKEFNYFARICLYLFCPNLLIFVCYWTKCPWIYRLETSSSFLVKEWN